MQREELLGLLAKYRLRPDKKLGQHYLIDQTVLDATVAAAQIQPGELILEIGAGPGILTSTLAKAGAEVLAVEFDRDFCRLLQDEYHNWRNVHVLCDDALRLDLANLKQGDRTYQKIVANIPYQITNPLVRRILEPGSPITVAVLLMQKEVADRLMAPVGSSDRGLLTVMVEYYGKISRVIDVPPQSFWPAPKVDSTVIRIERSDTSTRQLADPKVEAAFFWLVKQGFSGKRKTLSNSLSGSLQLPKTAATELVASAGIDQNARAEDVALEQWLVLFDKYQAMVKES